MQRKTPMAAAAALLLLLACGSPENEDFPQKPGELPVEATSAEQKRWELLAKELKIDDGRAGGDINALTKRLGSVPGWLDPKNQAAYQAKLKSLAATYAGEAYKTQCKQILSVTEVGKAKTLGADGKSVDLAIADKVPGVTLGAKVYVVKYLLQKDRQGNAEAETAARSGLLIMPDLTPQAAAAVAAAGGPKIDFPLVAFSHGGDKGLTYAEIAGLFGPLQANHVIIAPAFPGEPICVTGRSELTGSCDAGGKYAESSKTESMPFMNDVDDLLGMHDCFVRAGYDFPQPYIDAQADVTTKAVLTSLKASKLEVPEYESKGNKLPDDKQTVGAHLTTLSKRYGKTTAATSIDQSPAQPVSYVVGASRGGMTSQLALARAGGSLNVYSSIFAGIRDEVTKQVTALVTAGVQAGTIPADQAPGAIAAGVAAALPGAVVANLPAAREKYFGKNYVTPPKFQCHVDLFGPTTFLATQFRLGLEAFVKGYGDKTTFIRLPGGKFLNEKLSAYGKGQPLMPVAGKTTWTDEELARNAAEQLWRLDVPLQAPFVHAALQNWKYLDARGPSNDDKAQGAMLTLHGDFDRLVPVEQSKVAATVFFGVNASMKSQGLIPGLEHHSIGFTPKPEYLTKGADGKTALKMFDPNTKGTRLLIDHGDTAFLTSRATSNLTQCASLPEGLSAACQARTAELAAAYDFAGKNPAIDETPKGVLAQWLVTECEARQKE